MTLVGSGHFGLRGRLPPYKAIKHCILQLNWYKDHFNPGWIHFYAHFIIMSISFSFTFKKTLKLKQSCGPLKVWWTLDSAPHGEVGPAPESPIISQNRDVRVPVTRTEFAATQFVSAHAEHEPSEQTHLPVPSLSPTMLQKKKKKKIVILTSLV